MAQQPYMVLHRYYYHIYQMFSQVDFHAHVGGTAIAPAADLLVQGTPAAPVLAFDQAHWRRSKLSTAGRGISESGPSEHAACGGGDGCTANLMPNSVPDCVFHTLHEFSHIRHCIFAVFLHQFHDGGSYDDTI